eukprot:m.224226 g.224226  ORF g.224226 m.224226 type:complete len:74 (-) comp16423_c0_seq1:211-432(-)
MALGSILYFTAGGLFTGIYVNAVRQMPWFRKPHLLAVYTAAGAAFGYTFHVVQDQKAAEVEAIFAKHKASKSA